MTFRITLVAAACAALLSANAIADAQTTIDIPAGSLMEAIQKLSEQSGVEFVYIQEQLKGMKTQGVHGDFTVEKAVAKLLEGTGLQIIRHESGALLISDSSADTGLEDSRNRRVEEVVVTAQKRGSAERLQDVPVPVSVLNASKLSSNGQVLLRDYYATVPGLSLAPNYLAQQRLSIRGVQTGGSSPTVGITVDDMPYGAATDQTGGASVPDIDPGDLDHIEVLRGPQGVLYGANSMGGLVKYVTKDPSTLGFSSRVEAGANAVRNGSEPGFNLRASGNFPLSDTWAVRASAFTRQDPGYIDNPVRHIDGVNTATASGVRLASLWRLSQDTSLKLSAIHQYTDARGSSEVQVLPGLGDLQQNFLADTRGYKWTVDAVSALFKAKLGEIELTSVSGFNVNDVKSTDDRSATYQAAMQSLYGGGAVRYFNLIRTKKFTQEVRLATPLGERLEVWLGGFLTHENLLNTITMDAENAVTGQRIAEGFHYDLTRTYDEYAAFAGLTYRFSDRFDVQLGGRRSSNKLVLDSYASTGPFIPFIYQSPSPFIQPRQASDTQASTYLVTPRFKVSDDLMVYARFASGYRPGGPNIILAGVPSQYEPDTTENYEVGIKADLFDRALSIDASLYYIDWKDMQTTIRSDNVIFFVNGGKAKSEGAELSVSIHPTEGLTVTGWVVYNNAVLSEDLPAGSTLFGVRDDRLPFATRHSAYLSLEQEFPLWSETDGFVGGSVSYVGERLGVFQATSNRQVLPAYAKTDLRAGVIHGPWTTNLYINNVTDRRGLINGGLGFIPASAFAHIQPRTIGLSVSHAF